MSGNAIDSRPPADARPQTATREALRLSMLDGVFGVQYVTLAGGPLLAAFLLALGASEIQIGLVAAFPLLAGLAQPLGAEVIRRRGGWRRAVCLAGFLADLALWPVSIGAALFLEPALALWVVLATLALQYASEAFAGVAWASWISDLVPARLRGRFFGRRGFVANALGAGTAALAGWVLRQAGTAVVPVFCALIVLGIGFRAVGLYFLSRQPEPVPAQSSKGGAFAQFTKPLRHEGFRRYLTYGAVWNFATQLASPFVAVYMIREAGAGPELVMGCAALGTLANLLAQRIWGPLCDRYGDYAALRAAGLLLVLQPLGWLFAGPSGAGFYLMAVLSFTGGFGSGAHLLAQGNLTMRLAPRLGQTAFFATQAAFSGALGALGPLVGGGLAAALPTGDLIGASLLAGTVLEGLKLLFFLSFVLRLVGWGLLHRLPAPAGRRNVGAAVLLRDAVRTLNPAQGFSPLLHVYALRHDREVGKARRQSGRS